jgi:DNA modification methylase
LKKKKNLLNVEKSPKLYEELYRRYLKPGGHVMDLYSGTASSALALLERIKVTGDVGLHWRGAEKNKELHDAANKRLIATYAELFESSGTLLLLLLILL